MTILHALKSFLTGMPPHELNQKIGATIELRQNVMLSQGLCNGTRLTVYKDMSVTACFDMELSVVVC
jgi:hypothetical protein